MMPPSSGPASPLDAGAARRARMLAILCAAFTVIASATFLITELPYLVQGRLYDPASLIGLALAGILLIALALTLAGYVWGAALLVTVSITVGIFAGLLLAREALNPAILAFLLVPVGLAFIFLGLRAAMALTAVCLLTIGLLIALRPEIPLDGSTAGPLGLLLAGLVMIIVAAREADASAADQRAKTAEQEQRFRLITEYVSDFVLRCDRDDRVSYVSPAAERVLGRPVADLLGRPFDELITGLAPEERAAVRQALERATVEAPGSVTYRYPHPDGTPRWLEATFRPVVLGSGERDGYVIVVQDLTAVRAAEAALEQAQRLEMLGLLAGGVAHDFNNLLTGVIAQTGLAQARLTEDHPAFEHVRKAERAAERAAALTHQLLTYTGREHAGPFVLVDLNEVVGDTVELLETNLPRGAYLSLDLAPELPAVSGDRGQLQQVAMNLLLNAGEAVTSGGRVSVSTGVTSLTGAEVFVAGDRLGAGSYVWLSVDDTGVGLAHDALERVFDPFYTTKSSGRGLGLSATLGIVRAHGGAMAVVSTTGEGSRFTALLPVATRGAEEAPSRAPRARVPRVLVVDDEAAVREAVADILTPEGVEVVGAADGAAGIDAYREAGGFDVVLVDMRMPGLSGEETVAALRAIDPAARIIVSTGYHETASLDRVKGPRPALLNKPYDPDDLVKIVLEGEA